MKRGLIAKVIDAEGRATEVVVFAGVFEFFIVAVGSFLDSFWSADVDLEAFVVVGVVVHAVGWGVWVKVL